MFVPTCFKRSCGLLNVFKAVRVLCVVVFTMCLAAQVGAQSTAFGDHVKVRWLAPDSLVAGQQEVIGFYFEVDPHWHVYWHNPGDSGAAPRFDIQVQGATLGEVMWPYPTRLPIEHLTNLGYESNVAYLLPITAYPQANEIVLNVSLEWLVCKVDCIPGFGEMSLRLPVTNQSLWIAPDLALRDGYLALVPQQTNSPWQAVKAQAVGDTQLQLTLHANSTRLAQGNFNSVSVFPVDGEVLTATKPQIKSNAAGLELTFNRVPGAALPTTTDFAVVDGNRAWRLNDIALVNQAASLPANSQPQSFWWLLGAAFLGGVILNLMPCVFPVLSIKLFGLVQQSSAHRAKEGLVYAAGVLCTFTLLGAVLLGLRAGGAALGWGFQLQSPAVILVLITLFWLMALSFSGVFEFGHRLVTLAGTHRGGAFITGVLAVFVATPCTGPFMGAALGAAVVLPPLSAITLFVGLGAGLAAPFVALCLYSPLLHKLPKPGPWMETLRQFLAFPLYATVIWLLWVLGRLVGDIGWLVGASLMLSFVVAIWLASTLQWGKLGRSVICLGAVVAFVFSLSLLAIPLGNKNSGSELSPWNKFDSQAIAQARAQGRAIFIDYTAAWCITCQVNKKLVLDTQPIQDLFKQNNVYLVRADWTHRDDAITQSLAQLGRNSVPVYAWYGKGADEVVMLPQILTAGSIEALFEQK